ncbi:uncharacterized protein LOC123216648 isoform X1 [Mangifera indica]|uniref:uncharacterized protein LOC123216648 isoform X1 n=1 Tax=Mangifera indica TaxID=29780 RepID=UPI001CFB700B|nr:uncharacterized protein LOC123216648 isoform X1 [Mangifera indica]
MGNCSQPWLILLVNLFMGLSIQYSQAFSCQKMIKSAVFLSPKFVLGPGSVENKFYYNIDFPRGHKALKSFHAEIIDETGNPVPLHETYLHHWVVDRYYGRVDYHGNSDVREPDYKPVRNDGICQRDVLGQYFGLGSETRGTETYIPDPYGIEIGNPAEIPEGYEDRWMLNVHAIDTRGVEDKLGCTECRCDLYNITVDEYGQTLSPDYAGGLRCCYDHTQCRLRHGFEGASRSLYLKYTVKWVDWDSSIVPVKIYIFDVTDTWKKFDDSTGLSTEHDCQDGKAICASIPAYGNGTEAGNEAAYIVGMSTCYPQPGSVKIADGETLILESNYSSTQHHTGVMGLFYILVAEQVAKPIPHTSSLPIQMLNNMNGAGYVWTAVVWVGVLAVFLAVWNRRRNKSNVEYQPLMICCF